MRVIIFYFLVLTLTSMSAQESWKFLLTDDDINQWSAGENIRIRKSPEGIALSSNNDEAWISSPGVYQNFRLKGQFLLTENGSAKIAFRVNDPEDQMPELNGYAVHFDRNAEQQNNLGSIIDVARAKSIDSLKLNQWNRFEIIAMDDHLQVKINDQPVVSTHHRRSFSGHLKIGVTGEGATFKALQIQEIGFDLKNLGPDAEDFLISYPGVDYQSIFDGKSLEGWTQTGTSRWETRQGAIYGHSGGEGGFLVSSSTYQNFHLKFKFKIAKEQNSGIFIRKPANAAAISLQNSVECNIYDHNGYTHAYSTGALVNYARAWSFLTNYEDWNTGDIFALNDQIIMYINGRKASEAQIPDFNQSGNLCLQAGLKLLSEDKGPSEVWFKDLWIKCIDGQ
jgi:hypothetical protein